MTPEAGSARDDALRILVLGYLVRGPLGGLAWHHLQYVAGLARLGHRVYFLEDSGDWPACYDPSRHLTDTDASYGLAFAADVFARLGLEDCWGYFDAHRDEWRGPLTRRAEAVCASADLLLNVSGVNPIRPWLEHVPARILIDTDPGFFQARIVADSEAARLASAHTAFFTFGQNVGQPECRIPRDGLPWRPTRQPVVPDLWPVTPGRPEGRFTTVMQWDSYEAMEVDGLRLGMKSEAFTPYLDLPSATGETFEVALGSPGAPRERLRDRGWHLADPLEVTRDPWSYQQYLQRSKAEFSVAKLGYVTADTGWFSERSAVYLASGRPVVVQDTGFTRWIEAGKGLLAFSSPEEAVAAIESVAMDYGAHCVAAREVCREYFDSDRVLSRLLERGLDACED